MFEHTAEELRIQALIWCGAAAEILHQKFLIGERDKLDELRVYRVGKFFCDHEEAIDVSLMHLLILSLLKDKAHELRDEKLAVFLLMARRVTAIIGLGATSHLS